MCLISKYSYGNLSFNLSFFFLKCWLSSPSQHAIKEGFLLFPMCPSWWEDKQRWDSLTETEACEMSPPCWTEGVLPEDGYMFRRDAQALPHTVEDIACEWHPLWVSNHLWASFHTEQRFVQAGGAERPGVNRHICWPAAGPTVVELQQAGWVVWVSSQRLQQTQWRCAGSCAFAPTLCSEFELFFIRVWGKSLLDHG